MKKNDRFNIKSGLISALLVILCGIIIYSLRGRLFGEYTFIHGDMAAQYVEVAKLFVRQLFIDHNLLYSWEVSLGGDTLPLYAFYSCFSPFTLFYLLDFNIDILTFAVTFGKLALAAFVFNRFLVRYLNANPFIGVSFSVSYSLSGFVLAYYMNMIWFDALYMLPIIIGLVFDALEEKKHAYAKLVFAYAYIFIVNFYSGYVIGVFSGIAFLALLCLKKSDFKIKMYNLILFLISAVSSACISMILLYPTAKAMFGQKEIQEYSFTGLSLNILDVFKQLFIGETLGREFGRFPYIYCGILPVIFCVVFFASKKVATKYKIVAGFILAFYLACCVFDYPYLVMHIMDVPDAYNFRFSYIIIFILLSLASVGYNYVTDLNRKTVIITAGTIIFFYIVYSIVQYKIYGYGKPAVGMLLVNVLAILMYSVLLTCFLLKKTIIKRLLYIVVAAVCLEVIVNGISYDDINVKTTGEESGRFARYNAEIDSASDYLIDYDDSFYRVKAINALYPNFSMQYNYKSVGSFLTYHNHNVRKLLSELGYYSNTADYIDLGSTQLMDMILGEKYEILSSGWNDFVENVKVVPKEYCLPVGFMVSDNVLDVEIDGENVFENQNKLVSAMLGEKYEFFYNTGDNVEIELINAEEGEFLNDDNQNGDESDIDTDFLLYTVLNSDEPGAVKIIDNSFRTKYVYISAPRELANSKSPVVVNSSLSVDTLVGDSFLYSPHIVDVNNDGEVYIVFGNARMNQAVFDKIYMYGCDDDNLQYIYDKLSENTLVVDEYSDGFIKGTIIAPEDKVLFTTIPYEKGWEAYIDANEVEIHPIFNDAFIGIEVPIGTHNVVLKYNDRNIIIGFVTMIVGLMLDVVVYFAENKLQKHIKSEIYFESSEV